MISPRISGLPLVALKKLTAALCCLNVPFADHAFQKHGLALVIGLLSTFQIAAHGATLTVEVKSIDGRGIPEARVCIIGSGLSPAVGLNKFAVTKSDGTTAFADVPQGEFTLTMSKTGFVGVSVEHLVMGPADFTYHAPFLAPGSGGPVCAEPPPAAIAISNPKITTFEISKTSSRGSTRLSGIDLGDFAATTSASLSLRVEIDHPDRVHFYRLGEITCPESVSDHPEDRMKNFSWQPYTQGQSFSFRLDTSKSQPYGTRCVYMEVNRTENENSASPAKGDSVVLAPAHLKTFTLTGSALDAFLQRAKAVGYRFTFTGPSETGDSGCPSGTIPGILAGGGDYFEEWTAKVFDRSGERKLNPFWKMTGITIGVFLRDKSQTEIPERISIAQSSADDPFHAITFKEGFAAAKTPHDRCLAPTDQRPSAIRSITLEGPDDKQPEDSLFDPGQFAPRRLIRPLNPRP